jgi:tetratricopeptide (TPR) repeat protein
MKHGFGLRIMSAAGIAIVAGLCAVSVPARAADGLDAPDRGQDLRTEEAWLLIKLNRPAEACDVLRPILESGVISESVLDAAVAAFGGAGRWAEARKWVELRVQKNPDDIRLLKTLGEIRYQSGDAPAAAEAFEKLHLLGGGTSSTYHLLGDIRRSMGKNPEANSAYEKALAMLRAGGAVE